MVMYFEFLDILGFFFGFIEIEMIKFDYVLIVYYLIICYIFLMFLIKCILLRLDNIFCCKFLE